MSRLHVVLVDAPEQRFIGHKIRLAVDHNIHWWQELYLNYKPKKLDKQMFTNALERLIKLEPRNYTYDRMVFEIIKEKLLFEIKDQDVINYFETGVPF